MRLLACFIATSLDGYIAGPEGEIDWLFTDQDYGYTPFVAEVDTVVMGRKTFDLCLSFPEYPYPEWPNYVWSRTRHGSDARATFVAEDPRNWLAELKARPGRTIWLVGGGALVGAALAHDLLDTLIISIHPVTLGEGIPLIPRGVPARRWTFVKSDSFSTGLVQLTYRRDRESSSSGV